MCVPISEVAISRAFSALRPLCVEALNSPSVAGFKNLESAIGHQDDTAINTLQEYLLFPFNIVLKQNCSAPVLEASLSCLSSLLKKCSIEKWSVFNDFLTLLSVLLSENSNSSVPSRCLSEDAKLPAVGCIRSLTAHPSDDVKDALLNRDVIPAMGHLVSIVLDVTRKAELPKLQLLALDCLCNLIQLNSDDSRRGTWADIMASFLPGIVMGLTKTVMASPQPKSRVICSALECWRRLVILTMEDGDLRVLPQEENSSDVTEKRMLSEGLESAESLVVVRDAAWRQGTAEKLHLLVGELCKLAGHTQWRVRQALVTWATELLEHCERGLSTSVLAWLQVIVRGVNDSYPDIERHCGEALQRYRARCEQDGQAESLTPVLEDSLYELANGLPRLMRAADDGAKHAHLSLLIGHLRLLGPGVRGLLHSPQHLQRLLLALVQTLEMDTTSARLLDGVVIDDDMSAEQPTQRPRKHFKHFTEDEIQDDLIRVCRLLGCQGDLLILTDALWDMFGSSSVYDKEAVFMINEIVLGCKDAGTPETTAVLSGLVDDFLSLDVWSRASAPRTAGQLQPVNAAPLWRPRHKEPGSDITMLSLNHDVVLTSLVLEGLANISVVLGELFRNHLIDVLYVVMEQLGAPVAMVVTHARVTLGTMATSCGYTGVADMVKANEDYLLNSVSLRLRSPREHPLCAAVLTAMLRCGSAALLDSMADVLQRVLRLLDDHPDLVPVLLPVLSEVVLVVGRWSGEGEAGAAHTSEQHEAAVTGPAEQLCTFLRDRMEHIRTSMNVVEDVTTTGDSDDIQVPDPEAADEVTDGDTAPDGPPTPPRPVQLVEQVMGRCKHLMTGTDTRNRLLALDTVMTSCHVLRRHENTLLPLIHDTWPALSHRFVDPDHVVTVKSFRALGVMAAVSRDFIRQRVMREVVGQLAGHLSRQRGASAAAGPAYRHSAPCRLQRVLLEEVGSLALNLNLPAKPTALLLDAAVPYLHGNQPGVLQQACRGSLQKFRDLDVCLTIYVLRRHGLLHCAGLDTKASP